MTHPGQDLVALLRSVSIRRGGAQVLAGLDLGVKAGEVVAVMGPSGAGKSTLLAVLAGLLIPDQGDAEVLGLDVGRARDRERAALRMRRIGTVFQTGELLPELTLAENVTLPLRLCRGSRTVPDDASRVGSLLRSLGIADLADSFPDEVSVGQRQRAAIARALIHRPELVLADEPTAALDEASARTAIRTLVDLARARGVAVVVATHDRDVAVTADRCLTLVGGVLVSSQAGA